MGSLVESAKTVIASSRLSPVEKNILKKSFIANAVDKETAVCEILRRVDQDGVPPEEAELLSKRADIDTHAQDKVSLRDRGRCCMTGTAQPGVDPQPFHVISPALLILWTSDAKHISTLKCLEAFITPESARLLRQSLLNSSLPAQLENVMLLSLVVGQVFWKREIWLVSAFVARHPASKESKYHEQEYGVFGFAPEQESWRDDIDDGVQLFECSLQTCDFEKLPLPSPFLLKLHGCFAKAGDINDIEREVVKPWPPVASPRYWKRKWQLIHRGQQSAISEIVYNLPLGLYAKFCGSAQGELAALKLLETHAPSVPSPLFVDLIPLVADGKPWLIMTGMPGERVDEVIHRMSYAERHQLADDLAAAMNAYRRIPTNFKVPIASTSGSRLQDPRASSNDCGPDKTEADFRAQIARGCADHLARTFPNALSWDHNVVFTHADLNLSNILVDAGRLSGIVDWQFAGFYPDYWGYTKAMRSVRHAEHYQAIFRRIFGLEFEAELEVEEYLSGFFPIWGPTAPELGESSSA